MRKVLLLVSGLALGVVACKSKPVAAVAGQTASQVAAGPQAGPGPRVVPGPPVDYSNAKVDVALTLTGDAKAAIRETRSSVSVNADLSGQPKAGGDPTPLYGGQAEWKGQDVHFKLKVSKADLDHTDGNSPMLEVSVFSSANEPETNLLACTNYNGPLAPVINKTIPITCKMK